MANRKLFAGYAVRRMRRAHGLAQAALAEMLNISPSYLNLIERNQRPLTAALMLKLAELFDIDPRTLAADEPGGGIDSLRRRLADPMFAGLDIDRSQIEEWMTAAPQGVEAFARLFDHVREAGPAQVSGEDQVVARVRAVIERWRNHFADLDHHAESLADELRLGSGDPYGAIADRLRVKHSISVRILPADVMPDRLRRLDLHARQLQLSELLDTASRTFQVAFQLGLIEARDEIDAIVKGASLDDRMSERLFRRHLASYFAAALMMPYGRFLRACEALGYDIEVLQRRFGAGFEQVAHRLTTLQRVGVRGIPFFMLRVDRAGQVSKRYAGASETPLASEGGGCPLWDLNAAFERPGQILCQLVETEDGARYLTLARTVTPQAGPMGTIHATFAVGLGCAVDHAGPLVYARGLNLRADAAAPIGFSCRSCTRADCPQRSLPPAGRALIVEERERGLTPFRFAGD